MIVIKLNIPFTTFRSITGIGWHHEEIIKQYIEAIKAGDYEATAKFYFTKPTYDWPKGEYEFYTMCPPNTSTKKVMVTIE